MITAFPEKIFKCCIFFFFIITIYGCPYSSVYKLDDDPTLDTDENFLGKWAVLVDNNGHQGPVKMIVSKKDDKEYDIYFTGHINELRPYKVITDDTIKATAFMSSVVSRQFLNISIRGQVYIAECILKDNKLSLLPLNEHFTPKIIKSNAVLRTALEIHYKTRLNPFYDDEFSLKEMIKVN